MSSLPTFSFDALILLFRIPVFLYSCISVFRVPCSCFSCGPFFVLFLALLASFLLPYFYSHNLFVCSFPTSLHDLPLVLSFLSVLLSFVLFSLPPALASHMPPCLYLPLLLPCLRVFCHRNTEIVCLGSCNCFSFHLCLFLFFVLCSSSSLDYLFTVSSLV